MNNEYEGFSKQDLIDILGSLRIERSDNWARNIEIYDEIDRINKLLEE